MASRLRVARLQMLLDIDRTLHGPKGTVEYNEETIASRFDLSTQVGREEGSDDGLLLIPELERLSLVDLSGYRRTDHVREHDGGEPPGRCHAPKSHRLD